MVSETEVKLEHCLAWESQGEEGVLLEQVKVGEVGGNTLGFLGAVLGLGGGRQHADCRTGPDRSLAFSSFLFIPYFPLPFMF